MPLFKRHSRFRESTPREAIWVTLSRYVALLIFVSLLVPVGQAFMPETRRHNELDATLKKLESELADKAMQLLRVQNEEKLLKNEDYIALLAREKLGLMKSNEVIYSTDKPKGPGAPLNADEAAKRRALLLH